MTPSRVRTLLARLRGLIPGHRRDDGFDEEVEEHVALLADRFVAQGLSREEARYAALRQFGNVVSLREQHHEMSTVEPIRAFWQDMRHGVRLLRRNPAWATAAILTLTLGIGANVAIFGLVRPVLLEPLPYPDAGRLVVPATIFQRLQVDSGSSAFADVADWRAQRDLFQSVSAYVNTSVALTDGDEPARVNLSAVDDAYFTVMAAPPLLGRFFTDEEHHTRPPRVIVLEYALWMRRFGGDPGIVGRRAELSGRPVTIVGVTRQDSTFPVETEVFVPLGSVVPPSPDRDRRDNHAFQALARLRPGVSLAQAQAKLTVMGAQLAEREPTRAGTNWKLHTLNGFVIGPKLGQTLAVLLGAALLVLLVGCVNVANLLLARGVARERELAVRVALGASRWRVAGQLLAESAALSLFGGLAGLLLGRWGLDALVHLAPSEIPRLDRAHVDGTTLAFSIGLCAITTLLAGLAPAWQATRVVPPQSFHEAGRSVSGGRRAARLRGLLVVGELAMAIVLLTGAGLLVRSFGRLQQVNPGFTPGRALTLTVTLPASRYPGEPQTAEGFERISAAIAAVPGVTAASATSSLPLGGGGSYLGRVFLRDGQPEPPATSDTWAAWSVIQPTYFSTIGISLVAGRSFTARDAAGALPVIIVSQSMAKALFPDGNPLGRRIRSWRDENVYREIVGVVSDVRYAGLTDRMANNVYVPHAQDSWRTLTMVIRTSGDPRALLKSVREAIWTVDKKVPIAEVQTLDEVVDQGMARTRYAMFLLLVFGVGALLLSAVGIYGVIAYTVTQRTREIGIRVALGAGRSRVMAEVASSAMRVAGAGLACGLLASVGLTRLLASLLFEVGTTDLRAFVGAAALLLAVAGVAASIPAWRAARIDPVEALRSE